MWAQSANIPVSCLWIHTPHAYVWHHLEVNFLAAKTFGSKFVTISTLRTFVSLLSTVSQFMSCQGTRLREGLGQTFCDLPTHLHLFYRIFQAITINKLSFVLVYSVILGIFWVTLSSKHIWGSFQVIWMILDCATYWHFIYHPMWASCSEIQYPQTFSKMLVSHKILCGIVGKSQNTKKPFFLNFPWTKNMFLLVPPPVLVIIEDISNFQDFLGFIKFI